MNKKEFKELFIKLTEYTIPFGKESELEKYLPSGYKTDSVGNYYYEIGESETLFTTHLDTFSNEHEKVNHVIDEKDPYIIRTDETTILGGDNKLGCTILIGMIQNNIPGTYYFFLGEEPLLSGGLYGSSEALKANPKYFEKFKRCIAFDRREYGSVVVRQMARMCCSKEFASALVDELEKTGISWDETGSYGYYTDTATFMNVIEECTNISVGGFKEHYKTEWVNLNYTYKVYQSALKIDFESLPTVREIDIRFTEEGDTKSKISNYDRFAQNKNQKEISNIFKILGLSITRSMSKDGKHHLTFSKWLEDYDFDVFLVGKKIILNDEEVSMQDLKKSILDIFGDDIVEEVEYYLDLIEDGDEKAQKSLDKILLVFGCKDIDELDDLLG